MLLCSRSGSIDPEERVGRRCCASVEWGSTYRAEAFKEAFDAALKTAGVEKRPRPFHDLRHTAITTDALAGSSPIAVMTKAGHANMGTTKRYLHLAGSVFREKATAHEKLLLGEGTLYPSMYPPHSVSDDLEAGQPTPQHAADPA